MSKWMIRRNKANINQLAKSANISNISATILTNRNISNPNDIVNFLNPNLINMHDTMLMKDIKKGIEFIVEAIKKIKR